MFIKRLLIGTLALSLSIFLDAEEKQTDFFLGTNAHFSFGWGQTDANIAMMKAAGITSTRDACEWAAAENNKGTLNIFPVYRNYMDTASRFGISQFHVLAYANDFYDKRDYPTTPEAIEGFIRYAEFMVQNMPAGIRIVQIWNEWDGGTGMSAQYAGHGDAARYMKLLQAVYPRLKKIDPQLKIISGAFSSFGFLEKLVGMGLTDYCDAIALHTYNYQEILTPDAVEKWHARMFRIEQAVKTAAKGKKVDFFITEMGWPTNIGANGSTYESSADKLARLYLLARTLPFVKGIWWYDFQDDGWKYHDAESNFGIVRPDLTPKPAWYVLRDISKIVNQAEYVGRLETSDPNIWALRFRYPDGRDIIAIWSGHNDDQWQVVLKNEAAELSPISARHAGRSPYERQWGYYDWVENGKAGVRANELAFTLGNMPMILEGKLAQVKITQVIKRAFPEKTRHGVNNIKLPLEGAVVTATKTPPRIYELNAPAYYHTIRAGEPAKIKCKFNVEYDKDNLFLNITVNELVFHQEFSGEETWNGDG